MGMREQIHDVADSLLDFGAVIATSIASAASSVLATIQGDVDPDGNAEEVEACEVWESAAVLHRPAAPTSAGKCEVLFLRRGDELVGIATKDRRWQIGLAEGETVIRATGDDAARIRLLPDGTAQIEGDTVRIVGASVEIGTGTLHPIAYGDNIASYLASLKTWLDGLTLPVSGGTAGPAIVPSPSVPDVTSANHSVE